MAQTLTEVLAYYDSWLAFNQRYQRIPGVQAAVFADDGIAYSSAYGLADVEQGVALTEQHLFRIASHSKTFTATAVLQLVEQGKVRLDDKAGTHVTEIVGTPVGERTVRDLLSHAGGVTRDSPEADFWQLATSFPDREHLLDVLLQPDSAVIPENDRFKYSNIGYGLLGLIIEAATGMSYNAYVQKEVVDKLGLTALGAELDPNRSAEYAAGYSSFAYATERVPIEHVDTRALAAATGFYGNARDLVTYFSAHLSGDERLLTDASKRQMQHPLWKTGEEDGPRYGLGLQVSKVGKREVFGHGGGYPGHITRSLVDGERRIAVSVLTNAIDGPAAQLAEAVLKLVDLAESEDRGEAAGLARFTGRYANLWSVSDIALLGGRLYVIDPTSPDPAAEPTTLEADGDTLRVTGGNGYGSYGESYRFTFDADGKVESLRGSSGLISHPLDTFTLPARVTVQK
ncbi:CubicO group peptidase (beta-lactamase class C family) [Kribbella orskensis]|uniref:CubicO group peptidase (Beta-lactamase class C family) n=1 Tax=Kribbella orskensis TaxID=2512216 RepID=A0ABY2BR82_9ACTN|nr:MULTISPECIES: serine hydrolase [Kribbella]TCN37163.1 CubicO group peptidase (beta-lactamase class C family) [Kribbella sp. VKM Ac-2500]TCO27929.1 CubicO group peptidase (beta-lactamase class C family) [Kribbella orskensis]